jgi:hypothetical protein
MRTSILRYAFPLLLGFLALALAGPIRAFQDGGSSSQTPSSKPSRNDSRYTRVTAGTGHIKESPSSFGVYKGPNGEIINTVVADFGIIAAAKAAHQHLDHSAAEVIKQEDISDESGKVIGYRSVLTLVDKDGKKSTAIVITKGGAFRVYISASARDALAFEDYMKSLEAEHAEK